MSSVEDGDLTANITSAARADNRIAAKQRPLGSRLQVNQLARAYCSFASKRCKSVALWQL